MPQLSIYHATIIGIFENFVSLTPSLATRLVSKTSVLQWLLQRIQAKDHDENSNYAAELLPILLQSSVDNKIALGKLNGVEILLEMISVRITLFIWTVILIAAQHYRKQDPVDADETEFMENLFDALCSVLSESSIKKLFLEAEGPDLMILMIKCVILLNCHPISLNWKKGKVGIKNPMHKSP